MPFSRLQKHKSFMHDCKKWWRGSVITRQYSPWNHGSLSWALKEVPKSHCARSENPIETHALDSRACCKDSAYPRAQLLAKACPVPWSGNAGQNRATPIPRRRPVLGVLTVCCFSTRPPPITLGLLPCPSPSALAAQGCVQGRGAWHRVSGGVGKAVGGGWHNGLEPARSVVRHGRPHKCSDMTVCKTLPPPPPPPAPFFVHHHHHHHHHRRLVLFLEPPRNERAVRAVGRQAPIRDPMPPRRGRAKPQ